ncbi:MAG: PHP-associated domain-containing protein [Candidatus Eremiobacterota bacterium]
MDYIKRKIGMKKGCAIKIDIHCHTSLYSGCSIQTPEDAVETAIRRGIDGIVITEHDILWKKEELAKLQQKYPGFLILNGIEYSAESYDMLIYGIPENCLIPGSPKMDEKISKLKIKTKNIFGRIPDALKVEHVLDYFGKLGCAFILPHPFRFNTEMKLSIKTIKRFHGIEVDSSNFHDEDRELAMKLTQKYKIPAVTASDSHSTKTIGLWYIEIPEIKNMKDFVRIIKQGKWKVSSEK